VLLGKRYQNRPIYFSDVIVRREWSFSSFSDLRGATWSYNDPDSHSGYGITRFTLLKMGETNGYFGRVIRAGSHQASIRLVAEGLVDASAIDTQVLAVELRNHPKLAERLKVIDSLGPSTIQPVVVAAHLAANLKDEIRSVLVEMSSDAKAREMMSYAFVSRFTRISDTDYDDIRRMLDANQAAGFMRLR